MPQLASLDDLLVQELQDLYYAEQQSARILPKLLRAAGSPVLQDAIELHLGETERQIGRLEDALHRLGVPAHGTSSEAVAGLIHDAEQTTAQSAPAMVRDAALIAALERLDHYEIASYNCVCTYAELLGHNQITELLNQNLTEEEAADERLAEIAESVIGPDRPSAITYKES
jgi:ferritin-like metal-binding protein YciE